MPRPLRAEESHIARDISTAAAHPLAPAGTTAQNLRRERGQTRPCQCSPAMEGAAARRRKRRVSQRRQRKVFEREQAGKPAPDWPVTGRVSSAAHLELDRDMHEVKA